ncbi:patatin-like phospholipase domain-containing protein [Ditylenchus destructor]|uniref:triacylglycerol lipase n=1 Tax=Ditylenchus destructor TaxID=166010 RepID=A0AAD4MIZ5_9BILA|nr:patatin-like phospholipase domain-containing protein [Ditylenchus destructor]
MTIDFSQSSLSFAGCGFLCIYHAGVCAALKEYAPEMTRNRIYGASAGSIAAAGLICNVCISEATSAILQVVCEARAGTLQALSPTFDLMGLVRDGLNRILPDNAHELCSGRLFVSLTRYSDFKNVIVSQYHTKRELVQAIVCSCYIPYFCGFKIPEFRGVQYIDGGFSDNQPAFDSRTITISPFSGESDICPLDMDSGSLLGFVYYNSSIRFTTENLYRFCSCFVPPPQEMCSKICRQGFADALRFLTKNSITPCGKCLTIQSHSLPMPNYKRSTGYLSLPNNSRPRQRLDSECEVCLEKLESRLDSRITTALFPTIMQKTLEKNQVSEYRMLSYILSFRIVRWSVNMMSPIITPIEYTIYVIRTLKSWLDYSNKSDFFTARLHKFVDFILQEIEENSLLCSPKFSCQVGVSKIGSHTKSTGRLTGGKRKEPGHFSENDEYEYNTQIEDEDSLHHVVEYCKHHDAILQYYYTDDANNVQVCEIFDMHRPNHHAALTEEGAMETDSEDEYEDRKPMSAPVWITDNANIISEDSDRYIRKKRFPGLRSRDEDSGVNSLAEESAPAGSVKTRDACCSPVRHLDATSNAPAHHHHRSSYPSRVTASQQQQKQFSSTRRHTTIGVSSRSSGSSSGHKKDRKALGPFSSDSDAENGDDLFVANPRKRTDSNEYDGEPEPTDSDSGVPQKG